MTFEALNRSHISQIAAIEREAMDEPWSENMLLSELNSPSAHIIVGVEGDEVVCYGGFLQAEDEADVLNVAVKRELRGRGLGKLVMSELISLAKRNSVKTLTLEVREDNLPAIALYRGLGFETVGVRKRYYHNRFDALVMRLKFEEGLDSTEV